MDSPDRTLAISAAEVEGSPLFNFLCTLSPIKPVKSVHMAQTFSEISFPPPPSVFVSPRADLHKDFRSHEGNESKSGGEEVQTNGKRIFVRTAKRAQKFGKNTVIGSPSSSPSKLIEEYLTSPMEGEQNIDFYYSDVLKYKDGEAKNADTNDNEVESAIESKSSPRLELDKSLYTCIFSEDTMFNEQKARSVKSNQCNTQRSSVSNACQRSGDDENQLDFDEDESDFKFLMSEEDQILQSYRFMGDCHTEGGPSTLSGLSVEQVEIYIASLRDVVDKGHQMKSVEKATESSLILNCNENDNRVNAPMQRGTRRRCLDFEVSDNDVKMKTKLSVSIPISQEKPVEPTNPLVILRERASSTSGVTTSESPHNLDAAIQNHLHDDSLSTMVTCTKSTNLISSNCTSSKDANQMSCSTHVSPIPSSMPSGIGLHLNSLSETTPLHEINSSSGSIALMKPLQQSLHASSIDDSKNILRQGNSKGDIVSLMEETSVQECEHESKCSKSVVNSSRSITYSRSVTLGIKRVAELNGFDKRISPLCRKRVLLTDLPHPMDSERLDECNQSPKKRRLSSANDNSGEGCKRCNCKKSKCLKLYCECFAAGVYCIGNCTCQGCLNKPEFEEIVLETRQQIESRNPLAFAPKIMRAAESSPSNKEDYHEFPVSARHKRGCNCKKSHCLKKYCECYQVGVGCSDGCRCESCENVYGRKESAENIEEKDIQVETGDKECKEQIHTLDCSKEGIDDGSQSQNMEMSPITPFEYRGKRRNITKSRSTASRRSSPTFCLSSSMKQSRSPSNLPGSSKGAQSNSPGAPVKSSLPKVRSSPISTPRIMRIGQFSPRWDGLSDISTITPLPQAPARPTVATPISGIDGIDSSPSMNEHQPDRVLKNSPNLADKFTSRIPQHHHHQSSRSSIQPEAPLMRGTPPTPLFSSSRVKKIMPSKESQEEEEEEKESGHQFVGLETPKFLKDHEVGCSTICLLNSSSPKHKRISPPHHCNGLRETSSHRELQSPSSTSRRKFILRSISSIPPIPSPAAHEQLIGSTSCPNET